MGAKNGCEREVFGLSTPPGGAENRQRSATEQDEAAHEEAVLRFVEQFALILHDAGLPRMSARVFAFVLADDAESYTARELAEGLRVSPAAISGAVRQLVQSGLLAREREPGARVDHYRVYDDDVWSAIMTQRQPFIERMMDVLSDGLELVGTERPGGRRILETLEFYRFLTSHMTEALANWSEHRKRILADDGNG